MFNNSPLGEIRKLSGRLLIEALHGNNKNQDFLCELLDFDPLYGRITLNSEMPALIKQKLLNNPNFLGSIQHLTDASSKSYWSFPEYKEVVASVNTSVDGPNQKDSVTKYLNFPDSNLYLIGFKYKKQSEKKLAGTPLLQ